MEGLKAPPPDQLTLLLLLTLSRTTFIHFVQIEVFRATIEFSSKRNKAAWDYRQTIRSIILAVRARKSKKFRSPIRLGRLCCLFKAQLFLLRWRVFLNFAEMLRPGSTLRFYFLYSDNFLTKSSKLGSFWVNRSYYVFYPGARVWNWPDILLGNSKKTPMNSILHFACDLTSLFIRFLGKLESRCVFCVVEVSRQILILYPGKQWPKNCWEMDGRLECSTNKHTLRCRFFDWFLCELKTWPSSYLNIFCQISTCIPEDSKNSEIIQGEPNVLRTVFWVRS